MISQERQRQIVRGFQVALQRDNSDEIEGITLRELRDADAMHGNRDLEADFRIAMRNRIRELEEKAARER